MAHGDRQAERSPGPRGWRGRPVAAVLADRLGAAGRRRLARAWPAAALVLVLAVAVPQQAGTWPETWGIGTPAFIGLAMALAASGWGAGLLHERVAAHEPIARAAVAARAAAVAVLGAALTWYVARHLGLGRGDNAVRLAAAAGAALAAGGAARSAFGSRAVVTQLVMAAAAAVWSQYDAIEVLFRPFRDARLYLNAGAAWAAGQPVYLKQPLAAAPADYTRLPFVYPPFLLPLFGALSRLPDALAVGLWEVAAAAAAVLALRLLGVRWGWVPLLLLWPPVAVGLSVGNAAVFGLLGLAAGWRWGGALVLGGVFKAQAAIPALWLARERRWRPLLLGCAAVAAVAVMTLPLTGTAVYADWLGGLAAFEETVRRFPPLEGGALQQALPAAAAAALALAAVAAAFLARGRTGLSLFGIASVVASPTLYVHGLAVLLPAALSLDAAGLWLVLGIAHAGWGTWPAAAAAAAALALGLTRSGSPAAPPDAGGRGLPHPLGPRLEPWPDRAE